MPKASHLPDEKQIFNLAFQCRHKKCLGAYQKLGIIAVYNSGRNEILFWLRLINPDRL